VVATSWQPRGSSGPRHGDRQALAERGVRILDVEARAARRSPEGHRRLLRLDHLEAIRIFEDLGATATADKVRRALMEKGTRVPRGKSRAARNHAAGLTARQAEVLELLAKSFANTEIADELFVSHRTVENHVSAVLMKLDVATREAAVDAARDQGILDPAERREFDNDNWTQMDSNPLTP